MLAASVGGDVVDDRQSFCNNQSSMEATEKPAVGNDGFTPTIAPWARRLLRCPETGEEFDLEGSQLTESGTGRRYEIDGDGIAIFAPQPETAASRAQQRHYDRVATTYLANLDYPHTDEYLRYLDNRFIELDDGRGLGTVLEVCCGSGEVGTVFDGRFDHVLGIDISLKMVKSARRKYPEERFSFHQGDATRLPIADGSIDTAIVFGGIHHVSDRQRLFSELSRVLKPGGRLLFREPVDDFFIWRCIRKFVYRWSPALDHTSEAPLRKAATLDVMHREGFRDVRWKTYGFIGFCLFMNSDVLIANRLFRYLPCIRVIVRNFARFDHFMTGIPLLRDAGTIAVSVANKSA